MLEDLCGEILGGVARFDPAQHVRVNAIKMELVQLTEANWIALGRFDESSFGGVCGGGGCHLR